MASRQGLANLNVSALPMAPHGAEAGHGQRAVLVLTQERLHLLANSTRDRLAVDLLVVDEAHKVGDHLRGVILQDAVKEMERQLSINEDVLRYMTIRVEELDLELSPILARRERERERERERGPRTGYDDAA